MLTRLVAAMLKQQQRPASSLQQLSRCARVVLTCLAAAWPEAHSSATSHTKLVCCLWRWLWTVVDLLGVAVLVYWVWLCWNYVCCGPHVGHLLTTWGASWQDERFFSSVLLLLCADCRQQEQLSVQGTAAVQLHFSSHRSSSTRIQQQYSRTNRRRQHSC
jgi:hypothetical protein